MATARPKKAEGTVMIMDSPISKRASELGRAYHGRIEIDSVRKILRTYDGSTHPPDHFEITFPI